MTLNRLDNPVQAGKSQKAKAGDLVYKTLKEEILSGIIAPGELLSESAIARRFDVSRTPVREALNQLACDSIVVSLPQRGHLVRTISFSEVMEAFRLREMLEIEAVGEAARLATDAQIEALKAIIMDEKDSVLMNYRFHSAVARLSGSRLLAEFTEELLMLMQRLIINHPTLTDPEPELKIIAALESRDPEAARQAMREHLNESRDNLLNRRNGGNGY
jgi:DNA-binding GntR family transcriptional regulator